MNHEQNVAHADAQKGPGVLVVFADGKLRRDLVEIARTMSPHVQAAFSIDAASELCRDEVFDVLLLVGDAEHLAEAKAIVEIGGWAAQMPIVAVCKGSLDLAEARAAGVCVVIPEDVPITAILGALNGAVQPDARSPTWWVD